MRSECLRRKILSESAVLQTAGAHPSGTADHVCTVYTESRRNPDAGIYAGRSSGIYDGKTYVFDEDGKLLLETSADEGDLLYDEIGSVLEIKKLQNEKRELMEALEMFYRVVFLGEEFDYDEA